MPTALHRGHLMGLAAALCWGVMPIYFKLLDQVGPLEVVAHRIVWAAPLLLAILAVRRALPELRAALTDCRMRGWMLLSALLIAANWLIYVWAVQHDHIVAASLGYFISPLISVVLGVAVFSERLNRWQWLAVAVAAIGVAILGAAALSTLWVSLVLAASWGAYSLVRKVAAIGPVAGLTMETGILWLPAAAWLGWLAGTGGGHFGRGPVTIDVLLIGGALLTAVPLLLFAAAVRTVSLSALGLMQYVAPIIQFLTGIFLYQEPLSPTQFVSFLLIWAGLALYAVASVRHRPSQAH